MEGEKEPKSVRIKRGLFHGTDLAFQFSNGISELVRIVASPGWPSLMDCFFLRGFNSVSCQKIRVSEPTHQFSLSMQLFKLLQLVKCLLFY